MKTLLLVGCLGCGICLLTVGCANLQIGSPIREANIQLLRPGFTTKSEVMKHFGSPLHNVPGPEGEIWVYRYSDGKPNNTPKELTVSFNGNFVSTFSSH